MRLGALLGPITTPADPSFLANQARVFADCGYDSLWSAQATGRGFMMTDPLLALTVAATAAPGLEYGTAVLQVPLYQPVDLAHRVLSLQQLCAGPLLLGVGAGSTEADFLAFERPYTSRFADYRSGLPTFRQLLADGTRGDVNLTPWPGIAGRPELLLGSWGKGVATAARDYSGWIASGHYRTPDEVLSALAEYRGHGGGRAIVSTIQVSAETDIGELGERLSRFAEGGFDDAVVMLLPGAPSPETIRALV